LYLNSLAKEVNDHIEIKSQNYLIAQLSEKIVRLFWYERKLVLTIDGEEF
jgi:hypothetical protein